MTLGGYISVRFCGGEKVIVDSEILESKRLEDLRVIAKTLGIKSVTKYRKSELIDMILNNAKDEESDEERDRVIEIEDRSPENEIDIDDLDVDKLPDKVTEEMTAMS